MIGTLKPIPVIFWRSENGNEPVREWLKQLPEGDRKTIGEDLRTLTWLARRHAPMQIAEGRIVGIAVHPDQPPDCSRHSDLLCWSASSSARLHQEGQENTKSRS